MAVTPLCPRDDVIGHIGLSIIGLAGSPIVSP